MKLSSAINRAGKKGYKRGHRTVKAKVRFGTILRPANDL